MRRSTKLLALASILVLFGAGRAAADVNEMLNASAWVLTWEVDFTASGQRPESSMAGISSHADTLNSSFSSTILLSMRNAGPNLSMLKLSMSAPPGTNQQQQIMELVMRTDEIANWMYAPPGTLEDLPEPGKDPLRDSAQAVSGTAAARLHAIEVVQGNNLTDETGSKYNYNRRWVRKGSGKAPVPTQVVFELDSKAKHYMLSIPHEYQDQDTDLATSELHERTEYAGDPPTDTTTTGVVRLKYPERIEIDDKSKLIGEVLLLEGPIDASASAITGDVTIPAHYVEQGKEISGSLRVRFTLKPR